MPPACRASSRHPVALALALALAVATALALAACGKPTPPGVRGDIAEATSATGGAGGATAAAATAPPDDGVAQCRAWTTAPPSTTVYVQPDEGAPPSATFGADAGIEAVDLGNVVARTDDGWYAIDPGVAQAGNVGIYRLRWVQAAAAQIAGACGALPPIDVTPDLTPPSSGACEVTATSDVMVRNQYAPDAPEFGPLPAGNTETALARTADGWLGFDPGVAQAGNVGLYRLRWIAPDADVATTGDCGGLAVVFGGS